MKPFDKLVTFSMAVSDMVSAKDFYAEKLGFKIETDYRQPVSQIIPVIERSVFRDWCIFK